VFWGLLYFVINRKYSGLRFDSKEKKPIVKDLTIGFFI
jgi:hypothetical protein